MYNRVIPLKTIFSLCVQNAISHTQKKTHFVFATHSRRTISFAGTTNDPLNSQRLSASVPFVAIFPINNFLLCIFPSLGMDTQKLVYNAQYIIIKTKDLKRRQSEELKKRRKWKAKRDFLSLFNIQ